MQRFKSPPAMGPASTTLWSEAAEAVSHARTSVRWLAGNKVIVERRGPIPSAIQFRIQFLGAGTDQRPTILAEVEVRASNVSTAVREVARTPWRPRGRRISTGRS